MVTESRLVQFRKASGLSQDELSGKLGVSRQTISKWEVGTAVPSTENLLRLTKVYNISLSELLGEESPAGAAPKEENQKEQEKPAAQKSFLAVCVLSVCVLVAAVAACIGIYILNLKVDNLAPVDTAAPMEEMPKKEVDMSLTTESGTLQPLQP